MAAVHGKSTVVLVREFNLSTYCRDSTVSSDFDMAETSTYGNTYKTFIQGLGGASISLAGLYDSTAVVGPDVVLSGMIGVDQTNPVTVGYEGLAVGKRVFALGASFSQYEITGSIGDVVSWTSQFGTRVNTGGKSGVSLHGLTAETGTVNTASVDNAAGTTNGGYGLLHVTANTMDDDTVIKVQHSTNNSDWTDLATFTTVATTAETSEQVQVASATTVARYLRSIISATGTGSITYHVNFVRL